MDRVLIFDTTLRDGEQSPGATMTPEEKVRIARDLDTLGVDVIEAGFPISSPHELEAVRRVAQTVRRPVIAGLARCSDDDVDRVAEAVEGAARPRIHTFIATSDIHLERKLRVSREECLERVGAAVARARRYVDDVEFSAEDATRTDLAFLCRVAEVAIAAGATTVNLPDTVGYAVPDDFERIMQTVLRDVPGAEDVVWSVHCHNDLGLAVANSLRALQHGARQVECTINGIGERAGNAALEEIVMALRVRPDLGRFATAIRTERLCPTSDSVARTTGIRPQPNKAIVGANAFAHEAGIHQDGMLKSRMTYEIMTPDDVGAAGSKLVLGKHSGRHALARRFAELGFELDAPALDRAYSLFVVLAERKKEVHDEDLLAIYYDGTMEDTPRSFRLEHLEVRCGRSPSHALVRLSRAGGGVEEAAAEGDGPVDATFSAIKALAPWEIDLEEFHLDSAGGGSDAVGEARLVIRIGGRRFRGRAASTDIVDAAARAFLNAMDKAQHAEELEATAFERLQLWGV